MTRPNKPRKHPPLGGRPLPQSFADSRGHDPLEILQVWRSLYWRLDIIRSAGLGFRNLTWDTVRPYRADDSEPWSVALIDLDLAVSIPKYDYEGLEGGGAPAFMPIWFLMGDDYEPRLGVPEREVAFWIGFWAIRKSLSFDWAAFELFLKQYIDFWVYGKLKLEILCADDSIFRGCFRTLPGQENADEWEVVERLCMKIRFLQFLPKYDCPELNDWILPNDPQVEVELDRAIAELEKLRARAGEVVRS